jgi:hypothetical protein
MRSASRQGAKKDSADVPFAFIVLRKFSDRQVYYKNLQTEIFLRHIGRPVGDGCDACARFQKKAKYLQYRDFRGRIVRRHTSSVNGDDGDRAPASRAERTAFENTTKEDFRRGKRCR